MIIIMNNNNGWSVIKDDGSSWLMARGWLGAWLGPGGAPPGPGLGLARPRAPVHWPWGHKPWVHWRTSFVIFQKLSTIFNCIVDICLVLL